MWQLWKYFSANDKTYVEVARSLQTEKPVRLKCNSDDQQGHLLVYSARGEQLKVVDDAE